MIGLRRVRALRRGLEIGKKNIPQTFFNNSYNSFYLVFVRGLFRKNRHLYLKQEHYITDVENLSLILCISRARRYDCLELKQG